MTFLSIEQLLNMLVQDGKLKVSLAGGEVTIENAELNVDALTNTELRAAPVIVSDANVLGQLNITLSALRDAILGVGSKTLTDVASALSEIEIKNDAGSPVPMSAANLDIALSALRDALRGSGPKTLTDVVNAIAAGASSDVTDRVGRLLGHVSVDGTADVSDRAGRLLGVAENSKRRPQYLSGSASNSGDIPIASTEVFGGWVSISPTGTWTGTLQFEGSDDGATWFSITLWQLSGANGFPVTAITGNALCHGPVPTRYFRMRSSAAMTGTVTVYATLHPGPVGSLVSMIQSVGGSAQLDTELPAARAITDALSNPTPPDVIAWPIAWDGTQGVRRRQAVKYKTATATGSGNTALWTPTSGKKFRLLAFKVQISGNATQSSGGVLTVGLQDSSTDLGLTHSPFVPAVAFTNVPAWDSGWITLGEIGVLSAAANNVLNVNLGAAITAGTLRAIAIGTEE